MGIFDPKGLASSPTSQQTTNQGLSSYAEPYVSNYLNRAQSLVANQKTPELLNQSYVDAAGLKLPGGFATATELATAGGRGSLSTAPIALQYGQQGAQYGAQGTKYGDMGSAMGQVAARSGDLYGQQATDPNAIAQYMSPYMQNVVDYQKQQAIRDYQIQAPQMAAQSVGAGAFGGNRLTLQQAEANRGLQNRLAGIEATGQQSAFDKAQQAQQFGASLGLQGQQIGMQGQQVGLQGLGTAMQGQQIGLQGVGGAQQGYAGATQAGGTLGNIASQEAQARLAALSLKNQFGLQQQQFPYQQTQFLQGMMSGLPITQQNTQSTQAGPNDLSQILGLGGTLFSSYALGKMAGAFNKGGEVKRYASGGIASINRDVINDPTDYSEDTINTSEQNNVLGDISALLALNTIAKQKQNLQNQQAIQAGAQQPGSILSQLQAQAQPQMQPQMMPQQMAQAAPQGIDVARSNLPEQFAGGGIIAFEQGGDVPRFYQGGDGRSAFREDLSRFGDYAIPNIGIIKKLKELGSYFTTPRQAITDADAQPGGYYGGTPALRTAPVLPAGDIVIHPNAKTATSSGAPAAPTANLAMPSLDYTLPATDYSVEDKALAEAKRLIGGAGEDYEKAQKMAGISALLKGSLALGGGQSPYLMANLNAAGQTALNSYEQELQRIQGSKEKRAEKLAGIELKTPEMRRGARELSLKESEAQVKVPHYKSDTYKNLAQGFRTLNPIPKATGTGGGLGPINQNVLYKLDEAHKEALINPAGNVAILKQLDAIDPQASQYLLKANPKTKSYQNAYAQYKKLVDMDYVNTINKYRTLSTKGSGLLSSED
jgi:hypothetical protein